MDVQFESPFHFQLEVLETDDHVPSLRVSVRIVIEQFHHKYQYDGAFWIECAVWDSFLGALRQPPKEAASLHDMSENFSLSVQQAEQGFTLEWRFTKTDAGGKRQMAANFIAAIDEDALARVRRAFEAFPAWW